MIVLLSAILIAASIVWAAERLVGGWRGLAMRDEARKTRVLALLQLFVDLTISRPLPVRATFTFVLATRLPVREMNPPCCEM